MKERPSKILQALNEVYWAFIFGILPSQSDLQQEEKYAETPLRTSVQSSGESLQFGKSTTGRIARRSMRRTHPSGRTGRRT